jgi:hypothetical protein
MAIADEMKALKADPDNQILVAGIFGWPIDGGDMAGAQYRIAPVPNPNTADTQHPTIYDYWPVCYDPNHLPSPATTDPATGFDAEAAAWGATGGLREAAFVDEFGENGLKFSVCEPDFAIPMQTIGKALAKKIQRLCFEYKLVDVDSASPGIQADCRVVWRKPASDPKDPTKVIFEESPVGMPQCPPGASNGNVTEDCWQLAGDTSTCPVTGQLVHVLRTADEIRYAPQLDPGIQVKMECRTCPELTSGSGTIPGCDY